MEGSAGVQRRARSGARRRKGRAAPGIGQELRRQRRAAEGELVGLRSRHRRPRRAIRILLCPAGAVEIVDVDVEARRRQRKVQIAAEEREEVSFGVELHGPTHQDAKRHEAAKRDGERGENSPGRSRANRYARLDGVHAIGDEVVAHDAERHRVELDVGTHHDALGERILSDRSRGIGGNRAPSPSCIEAVALSILAYPPSAVAVCEKSAGGASASL